MNYECGDQVAFVRNGKRCIGILHRIVGDAAVVDTPAGTRYPLVGVPGLFDDVELPLE